MVIKVKRVIDRLMSMSIVSSVILGIMATIILLGSMSFILLLGYACSGDVPILVPIIDLSIIIVIAVIFVLLIKRIPPYDIDA